MNSIKRYVIGENLLKAFIESPSFLIVISVVYLTVAFNSVGFHQYDEHFQIVEFANYKMGWIERGKLTWEYRAKIRSGLQPMICYVIFKVCELFGETDGYNLAFILRLVSAIFSVVVIKHFIKRNEHHIAGKIKPFFIFLSFFLWFLPYINVRFSSENWSGQFLLLSLAALQKQGNKDTNIKMLLVSGTFLGISILFRYQSVLFAFGVMLWLIFVQKSSAKGIVVFCTSILIVLGLGVLIDYWLYNEFVLPIFNYFYTNIVRGVAAQYGVAPWYQIVLYIFAAPGPFGTLIIIAFLILARYEPKNIIIWAAVPFLIVHALTPHKELRFMFPIANLTPLALVSAYQHLSNRFSYRYQLLTGTLFTAFIVIDIAGLLAVSLTGASYQVAVTNFIHRNYDERRVHLLLNDGLNPYIEGPPLCNTFYDGRGVSKQGINSFWQENLLSYKRKNFTNLLILSGDDYTGPRTLELFKRYRLEKVYQNIPDIVRVIYSCYDSTLNESSILVYEFR